MPVSRWMIASLIGICWGAVLPLRADEPADGNDSRALVVVSSNVRYGTADDGPNRWEMRRDLLTETLRRTEADLIGTQEILPFQAEQLSAALERYEYLGRSRDLDDPAGEQCGIFFRRDRFVLLELGHFWLSDQPQTPGSRGWDAALPRMATWVKLYDRRAQRPLILVNTHFDHVGREARRNSAELLRATIAARFAPVCPVILTGDFNAGEDSPPYASLVTASSPEPMLQDTFRVVNPERQAGEGTFNGFRGQREGGRIDWILATPEWRVKSAGIIRDQQDGRYPSDHFPVSAQLEWGP